MEDYFSFVIVTFFQVMSKSVFFRLIIYELADPHNQRGEIPCLS